MSVSGVLSSVLLHYTINVAGMSWPVRHDEVALQLRIFRWAQLPNFRNDCVQAPTYLPYLYS